MHILIAAAAIAGAIIFWVYRVRAASEAAGELADMASDVMAAARRFGFRRKYNTHPVDSIEDANLAAGALSVAFLDLGPSATQAQRDTHLLALQSHLGLSKPEAEEVLVLGHWFVNECHGPNPALTRLGKRLFKLGGSAALDAPLKVVDAVASASGGLSDSQRDALHELSVIFHRR